MNCIETVPIFKNLTEDEMMEVAMITNEKKYKKSEMIYMEGDIWKKLFVIHKGVVKVSKITESGKEQVVRLLGPGDFLGELSMFSPVPMPNNAEAIEDVTMCIIDGDSLNPIMKEYPSIAFKVMETLSSRLSEAENLLEDISLNSVEKRIAGTLIRMSGGKDEVNLQVSKGTLASYIGMSQETLSRKLRAFEDQGIIEQRGHRKIIIKDKESLIEIE